MLKDRLSEEVNKDPDDDVERKKVFIDVLFK